MHIEALIILPSSKCAIALLLYSLIGFQFFLIAVHFNSFAVKMNSTDEISFLEGLITLIPINISCGCKEKIKNNLCQSLWL